jgi:hypothetical protein
MATPSRNRDEAGRSWRNGARAGVGSGHYACVRGLVLRPLEPRRESRRPIGVMRCAALFVLVLAAFRDPTGRGFRARVTKVKSTQGIISQLTLGRPVLASATVRKTWADPDVSSAGRVPEALNDPPWGG